MANGQLSQQTIDATNQTFLAMVNWKQAKMNSPTGIYKSGQTTVFTMDPTGGYARGIWLTGVVDVDVTLGTGAAVTVSPFAPYTLFNRIRVRLGNLIHDVHPYAFALVYQQSNNAGQDFTYTGPNPQTWAQGVLFGSENGGTGSWQYQVAAGENDWYFTFYIPLQFEPDDVSGLVPLGASANKLTLELDPCVNGVGTDPLVNPVVLTTAGTTSTTVTVGTNKNSLTAVVEFADMNTLLGPTGSGLVVPNPIIQNAIYLRDNVTPYPTWGNYLFAYMEEPYTFQRLIAMMNDNYTATNSATYPAQISQNSNLTGLKLNYDGQNMAREWSENTGGLNPYWMRYKGKYGNLPLQQGILTFDFMSGQDPRHPSGQDLLNAALFTQARIGLNYSNPGGAGNGAYVRLIGQYIVPQSYN